MTWQLCMPKQSRESLFDRHLSFDTISELNTTTLPRDGQIGPLCDVFFSVLGYDPGWSPPLRGLRSPAPRPLSTHTLTMAAGTIVTAGAAASLTPPPSHVPAVTRISINTPLSPLSVVWGPSTFSTFPRGGGGRALSGYSILNHSLAAYQYQSPLDAMRFRKVTIVRSPS